MWNVKLIKSSNRSCNTSSFIWTMWNVKEFINNLNALVKQFYLNYVECKVLCECGQRFFCPGFIWTMWNVKQQRSTDKCRFGHRFIWTMWNVKFLYQNYFCTNLQRFYLNYVECKDRMGAGRYRISSSFIWTMWNVKDTQWARDLIEVMRFIWTMWNVKQTNSRDNR